MAPGRAAGWIRSRTGGTVTGATPRNTMRNPALFAACALVATACNGPGGNGVAWEDQDGGVAVIELIGEDASVAPGEMPAPDASAAPAPEEAVEAVEGFEGATPLDDGKADLGDAGSGGTCPAGTVLVEGEYCPFVGHRCLKYMEGPVKDRCAVYAEPPICEGKKVKKRYCIDEFEYPNQKGVKPAVMSDWFEAKAACEAEGKRLCTSSEWTLACEGEPKLPYPYGFKRDAEACNIDKDLPTVDFEAFSHAREVSDEVARLDQREPSGARDRCVSPFGVHDMTGNVDEWVVNEQHFEPPPPGKKAPYVSGLKGGYWGPVRDRCRPITTFHNEWFRFYQVGFRCCADAK